MEPAKETMLISIPAEVTVLTAANPTPPSQPPVTEQALPEIAKVVLFEFQREGVAWMLEREKSSTKGGFLCDDMGLGKTKQSLTLVANTTSLPEKPKPKAKINKKRKRQSDKDEESEDEEGDEGEGEEEEEEKTDDPSSAQATLFVVPANIIQQWQREIKKHTPLLLDHTVVFTPKTTKEDVKRARIVVVSYEKLRTDLSKKRTSSSPIFQHQWKRIVLDESHMIRNSSTATAKAVKKLKSELRWCLSGTPTINRATDLASQCRFLKMSPQDKAEWYTETSTQTIQEWRKKVILRRMKRSVLKLPDIKEEVVKIEMSAAENKFYNDLVTKAERAVTALTAEGTEQISRYSVLLEWLLRIRQAANDVKLVDKHTEIKCSSKAKFAVQHMKTRPAGDKILAFSQWTKFLDIVQRELDAAGIPYVRFDGDMSKPAREESIQNFRTDPNVRVMLISAQAGGLGLTLAEANHVYLLDQLYNPAMENQAIARVDRIG